MRQEVKAWETTLMAERNVVEGEMSACRRKVFGVITTLSSAAPALCYLPFLPAHNALPACLPAFQENFKSDFVLSSEDFT
jgi:hypothetical protein